MCPRLDEALKHFSNDVREPALSILVPRFPRGFFFPSGTIPFSTRDRKVKHLENNVASRSNPFSANLGCPMCQPRHGWDGRQLSCR